MKFLRRIHLYLGCVFAPLLVMFATSGAWQTFQLHRGRPGYDPPNILIQVSSVHEAQRLMIGDAIGKPARLAVLRDDALIEIVAVPAELSE